MKFKRIKNQKLSNIDYSLIFNFWMIIIVSFIGFIYFFVKALS